MSRVFKVDYIPDPERGRPLWNAKIYVGIPNEDPTIPSNQIQLTGDIGFPVGQSIPVPQPVRTNKGGVTVYNNSPLDLNSPGQQYAIAIYDRNDNLIYNFPQVDGSVAMNTTSQEEVTGLTIWPEVGEAVIGQTIPAGTDAIRYPFNGRSTLFTIKPPVAVTGLITDITINSSGIGTLEVDNSDVYDLAEFNSFIAANDGDSQLAGGAIWPLSSQESISTSAPYNELPIGTLFVRVNGSIYRLNEDITVTSTITIINEAEYTITAGGTQYYLLPDLEGDIDIEKYTLIPRDGSTDAAPALLNIAASSDNRDVYGFSGNMFLSQTIQFLNPKSFDFGNAEFTVNRDTGSFATLGVIAIGSLDVTLLGTTAAPINEGDTSIGAFAGVNVGDWICIYNQADGSYSGFRPQYRQGEYAKVVATAPTVIIDGTIEAFGGYPAGVEVYKLDARENLKVDGKAVITNIGTGGILNGVKINNTFELDLASLSVTGFLLSSACTLTRCGNINGNAVNFYQEGDVGITLQYGLVYDGCQNADVHGNFYAERHGSTTTSSNIPALAINRHCFSHGRIKNSGAGLVAAAELHGNSEYCGFGGFCDGIIMAGHGSYTARGTKVVAVNGSLSAVKYTELSSAEHMLDCEIVTNEDHSTTSRGVIDCGGNSSNDLNAFTTRGGEFDFSRVKVTAPNQAGGVITLRNRGATVDFGVNLNGFKSDAPNSTFLIIGTSLSGNNMDYCSLGEIQKEWEKGLNLPSSTDLYNVVYRGEVDVTVTTGDFLVQEPVVFPDELPRNPAVQVTRKGTYAGATTYPITTANAVTTTGMNVALATADGGNFSSGATYTVSWEARSL